MTGTWSNEKIIDFVNEVHLYPQLWNVECGTYKDRNAKKDGWADVAQKFYISTDEAYKKFRSLRTYAKTEERKKKSGSAGGKPVKWFAFDALSFVLTQDTPNTGLDSENSTVNISTISLRSTSSSRKSSMNAFKESNMNQKKWAKKNKKIKKLFQQLRESSTSLPTPSLETSTLDSTASSQTTVINLDETCTPARKRKSSPDKSNGKPKVKKMGYNSSIIVITDDDASKNVTPRKNQPIHCSTPLGDKANTTLNDLNVSCITNGKNNNCLVENFNNEVSNLANDIEAGNIKGYHTVDLTGEVEGNIIDLNNVTDSQDCILVSSNTAISDSESEITVLRRPVQSPKSTISEERKFRKVAKGLNGMIANLNSSSQGRLLELITQNIFSGCNVPKSMKDNLNPARVPPVAQTPEDIYIKEMFLGDRPSDSSIGSNIYNPDKHVKRTGPRIIVIDGSNVAMEHGRGREFSVKGLKICIDYFVNRGHAVRAFVPRFRCKFGKSTDPRLLDALERRGLVVYTPSRELQGKMIASYDDRYIVQYAAAVDGVIVSGDNYRDLVTEHPRWRRTIEQRVLPFTWVQDMIMFPKDPLGRNGPTLEQLLRYES